MDFQFTSKISGFEFHFIPWKEQLSTWIVQNMPGRKCRKKVRKKEDND